MRLPFWLILTTTLLIRCASGFVLVLLVLIGASCRAPVTELLPLNDPRRHAGCYVENADGAIIANLSEEDAAGNPQALFHLDGVDSVLPLLSYGDSLQVFGNERYRIEVGQTFVEREPGTCLEYYRFEVKIETQGRSRTRTYPGFCGC